MNEGWEGSLYLGHLFTVSLRVEGGLSQENWMLLGGNTQLIVEGVVPNFLHIIPVGNNSVLDRVFYGQDTSLGLGLVTYVRVFLAHTHHDTLNNGSNLSYCSA